MSFAFLDNGDFSETKRRAACPRRQLIAAYPDAPPPTSSSADPMTPSASRPRGRHPRPSEERRWILTRARPTEPAHRVRRRHRRATPTAVADAGTPPSTPACHARTPPPHASTPASPHPTAPRDRRHAPPLPQLVTELRDLVVTYVKQETVVPLKQLGRYVGFGLAGSLLLGFGVVFLALSRPARAPDRDRRHVHRQLVVGART